jgi:hypothetical protein
VRAVKGGVDLHRPEPAAVSFQARPGLREFTSELPWDAPSGRADSDHGGLAHRGGPADQPMFAGTTTTRVPIAVRL